MSDEVARSAQNEELQAQLQLDDLGTAHRNHIFSVDPGHRGVNLNLERAVRKCNDLATAEGKQAAANRKKTAKWANLVDELKKSKDKDALDDTHDPTFSADGQSHRRKLRAEAEAGNLEEDTQPAPPYRGNKNKGKYHNNSVPNPRPTLPLRDLSRNLNGGRDPVFRTTQDPHASRPVLQPKSRSTGPKSNAPRQNVVAHTRGNSSGMRAPPSLSSGRLTPPTPQILSKIKKRPVDSKTSQIAEGSPKRVHKYHVEPNTKGNGQKYPTGTDLDPARESNQKNPQPPRRFHASGKVSKLTPLTKIVASSSRPQVPVSLIEASFYNSSTKWPGSVSIGAEICDKSTTASLPEPKASIQPLVEPEPVTQQETVTAIVVRQEAITPAVALEEPVHETPDLIDFTDTTDLDQKKLEELRTSFAALKVTSRPSDPFAGKPGLEASRYATNLTPPQSVASSTTTMNQTTRNHESAISSADAFWKWKAAQKPNRNGF